MGTDAQTSYSVNEVGYEFFTIKLLHGTNSKPAHGIKGYCGSMVRKEKKIQKTILPRRSLLQHTKQQAKLALEK